MKKSIAISVAIVVLLALVTGCVERSSNNLNESASTNNNWNDFVDNIPAKVNDEMLHACYRYADSLGYGIKDRDNYKSVLLGESLIDTVYTGEDNDKCSMIDKSDYLVIFEEIRIVIDAETGAVLGHIPYV